MGCFYPSAIVNSAPLNMGTNICSDSFGYMPRSVHWLLWHCVPRIWGGGLLESLPNFLPFWSFPCCLSAFVYGGVLGLSLGQSLGPAEPLPVVLVSEMHTLSTQPRTRIRIRKICVLTSVLLLMCPVMLASFFMLCGSLLPYPHNEKVELSDLQGPS